MTVSQMIRALQALKDQGYGRRQVVLTDFNSESTVGDIAPHPQENKKQILIAFEYGDLG